MTDHNKLPWPERVNMLSINPDAATREDIARMAADLAAYQQASAELPVLIPSSSGRAKKPTPPARRRWHEKM